MVCLLKLHARNTVQTEHNVIKYSGDVKACVMIVQQRVNTAIAIGIHLRATRYKL